MSDINRIKKTITGCLAGMIMIIMICSQTALAASSHSEMSGLAEPQTVSQVDAADGIVRIQAGTTDESGKFTAKNTFSGFVVSKDGSGGAYIVTTWHSVNVGDNAVIRVTVKNDTVVEAGVEAFSKEQDFCILSAGSMKSKEALPLRIGGYDSEDDALSEGGSVTALGFSSGAGAGTEFSSADVRKTSGKITGTGFETGGASYIEHSADISGGLEGGPLTDENGYVIGMNNPSVKGSGGSCALDIMEVDKLLDSNGIEHRTKDKDELYASLYELCDQSIGMYKKVKKSYRNDLYEEIQNAIEVMSESPYDRSELQSAYDGLKAVVDGAELKTSKLLILIIALAAVIVGLAARLGSLMSWNKKHQGTSPKAAAGQGKTSKTAPAEQEKEAVLIIRRSGSEYKIDKNIFTMGRSTEADVTIQDNQYVARMHAMIEKRKGAFYLHDTGSKNGTFLNGSKVTEEGIRLISGDIISLGNEEVEFRQL